MFFISHQQTTVEEQSRIIQLEEELTLQKTELENLQAKLRGSDMSSQQAGIQLETPVLHEQPVIDSDRLKEKYETALTSSQQEVYSLKAVVDSKNQEIIEMKQKVQQATKENMEMMDSWKVSRFILLSQYCKVYVKMADVAAHQKWSQTTR